MSDLNSKLRWLTAVRLLIVVSIAGLYGLYQLGPKADPIEGPLPDGLSQELRILIGLLSVVSVQTLVYVALLRWLERHPKIHAYLQFVGDLVTITLVMAWLGPTGRSFAILYLVVISIASVFLRRSAGIVVAALASLFYAVGFFFSPLPWPSFLAFGFWPQPVTQSWEGEVGSLVYSLTAHLGGFFAVALLTSYLARDVARAEENLRAKNLDLAYLKVVHRDIVQSISSGLATTDLTGVVTSLNKCAEAIFERKASDLMGLHVTQSGLFDLDKWQELTEQTGGGGGVRAEIEHEKDGQKTFLGLTLSPLRDAESLHRGYILVLEDLTERRRLLAELRVKDRMAAIGEMAAGLAHEVGNPLAAISGSVQVLSGSIHGDAAQAKLLEILLKESRRLDRTVKSFLQLASSRQRRLEKIDIAALLSEDVELLRLSDDVHEGHTIVADVDPPKALIRADPDQIGQIFWNLARNALQAMPGGGQLEIRGRLDGAVYRLSFRDTGRGMTEDERATLFHPFRSFFDQGTGIGMAIVFRIVEEHGGKITATSRPGAGTTIDVELPVDGPSRGLDKAEDQE